MLFFILMYVNMIVGEIGFFQGDYFGNDFYYVYVVGLYGCYDRGYDYDEFDYGVVF